MAYPVSWEGLLTKIEHHLVEKDLHIYSITTAAGPFLVGPYDVLGSPRGETEAEQEKRHALFVEFKKEGYLISDTGKNAHHIVFATHCDQIKWPATTAPSVVLNKRFHLAGLHGRASEMLPEYSESMSEQDLLNFYWKLYTQEVEPELRQLWWIAARMIRHRIELPRHFSFCDPA